MSMSSLPRHYGDELPLYVAGHVSPEERAAIEDHLSECAACRHECDLWRSMPDALAALDSVPSTSSIWSKLAPRLSDNSPHTRGSSPMSLITDTPPRLPLPSRATRTIRPNTWTAVAIVLGVIVLMGGFLAAFKGRTPPSTIGAQPTSAAKFNVSGVWTGTGASMLDPSQQDCYRLDLTQSPDTTRVTGNFGEFQSTCGSPYLLLSGTLQGSQLHLSNESHANAVSRGLALAIALNPMQPASSCGPTTLALTYHPPATLSGTITNCSTISITLTRESTP